MPDLNPLLFTEAEQAAYLTLLNRDGAESCEEFREGAVSWVEFERTKGTRTDEIYHAVIGGIHDMNILWALGPTFRSEAITLAKGMVRQAIEMGPQSQSDEQPHA
jgi:hypothetical protein